ncbi:hypothetical protein [Rhabdaerophilum sp. SD176]|uniref:hypothetical protein n=1 Tax=Rhabdaerophilum sp. SD176 TaxID=2983548 RepID=UPI0024DFC0C0|nr:hypothetical protein [Rhabdaerophilum sp. SD176]
MKIGILAFGSLIDSPDWEIEAVTTGVDRGIRTPFAVEYARSSNTRGGAATLVPVESGGAQVAAVIFTISAPEKIAANILYRREIHKVGTDRIYKEPAVDRTNTVRIERLANFGGYDLVLSTRIAANISPLSADHLADLAIASAKTVGDGKDGISYLIAARANGIVTGLSEQYEAKILERLQVDNLTAALAAIRKLQV